MKKKLSEFFYWLTRYPNFLLLFFLPSLRMYSDHAFHKNYSIEEILQIQALLVSYRHSRIMSKIIIKYKIRVHSYTIKFKWVLCNSLLKNSLNAKYDGKKSIIHYADRFIVYECTMTISCKLYDNKFLQILTSLLWYLHYSNILTEESVFIQCITQKSVNCLKIYSIQISSAKTSCMINVLIFWLKFMFDNSFEHYPWMDLI